MGFLDNSNIGFGDISVGGGSSGSSQNPNVVFKENDATLLTTEKNVASKAATSNIEYILPSKDGLDNGSMFEIINMNTSFNITITDAQNSNIEGQASFTVSPQGNISLVLDKENSIWKIINGI